MADAKLVDKSLLRTLVPANALNSENFQELSGKAFVEDVPAGKTIFKAGEVDRKSVYLLEGQVALIDSAGETVVSAGSEAARHALANNQPRKHTAKARTDCKITRLDADLLDILLTWDQLSGIEVNEIQLSPSSDDDDSDWMTRILQSKAFLQIPPANIQAMFMRMQEVPKRAGELVIRQGDEGDYYYIIKSGRAKVSRTSKTGAELTLATLKDGDAFGEEALLSEAKRNATIIMETDGFLMRLAKEDFIALLKEPMINWIGMHDAAAKIQAGAKWLDVRLESEHANNGLPDSLNIPLFVLRLKVESLNPAVPYIVYCDTGRRSSAAAFLLNERGFQTFVLKGGTEEQGI
jgi:CRP-like cAMP-binding protein